MTTHEDYRWDPEAPALRGRGARLRSGLARVAFGRGQPRPRRAPAVLREAFAQGVIFGFVLAAVVGYALVSALRW
jgi:hypothetical protein